jgi:hypothetical protein
MDLGRRAEMRMKNEHRASRGGAWLGCLKRKEEGKGASDGETRLLYLAKAAGGRARACLMRGVAVSACELAVWFITFILIDFTRPLVVLVVYYITNSIKYKEVFIIGYITIIRDI